MFNLEVKDTDLKTLFPAVSFFEIGRLIFVSVYRRIFTYVGVDIRRFFYGRKNKNLC